MGIDHASSSGIAEPSLASTPEDSGAQVEFVLVAEAGILERQAVLLCDSIRRFAGSLSSSAITVVSPRRDRRPSQATLHALDRLRAEYLPLDIRSGCPDYGPSLRVHALGHVARRSGPAIVVQVDCDSVFVGEPTLLAGIDTAAARPVDLKGMCTSGPDDAFDHYWRVVCALFGVEYCDVPLVRTTVDRILVRASYNAGLFAARRDSGIFERTEEFFQRLVAANLRPWLKPDFRVRSGSELVSEAGSAFWGTSQAALSLAAVDRGHAVALLPESYNFPLHCLDGMAAEIRTPMVHIHYHWLASEGAGEANTLLHPRLPLTAEVREWLHARLPLRADGSISAATRHEAALVRDPIR